MGHGNPRILCWLRQPLTPGLKETAQQSNLFGCHSRTYPHGMDAAHFGSAGGRERQSDWLQHREPGPLDDREDDARARSDRHFAEWRCSVCGHALGEHLVDHSGEHTVFECPGSADRSDDLGDPGPLNETGQTRH